MPVLNRAELSRTGVVFVALLFAMCATGAVVREFRAAETQTEDYPTVEALRYMGALIAERTGGRHEIKVLHSRQLGEEKETSPEVLVISLKAWRSLSADDQQIFREAALRSNRYMREKWRDLEEQSQRKAEATGIAIVRDIDRTPFEDAMAPIYAKAARDPAAAGLIERVRRVE